MRHRSGEQIWRKRLEQKNSSGLTVAAFCQQEAVSVASYYYWKRRLENQKVNSDSTPSAIKSRKKRFVAIDLSKTHQQDMRRDSAQSNNNSPSMNNSASSSLEVVLRNGRRVVVPNHFEPNTLKALLAILEDSAC